ncbi:Hypothetical protein POVR1_LOCUS115 [uncultured virus]|nr:Hypothetical protein POVR1_LOCUS115 [uncultured virus]
MDESTEIEIFRYRNERLDFDFYPVFVSEQNSIQIFRYLTALPFPESKALKAPNLLIADEPLEMTYQFKNGSMIKQSYVWDDYPVIRELKIVISKFLNEEINYCSAKRSPTTQFRWRN